MQLKTVIARAFGGRWTRILAGVVAATVLLPVPALGLVSWTSAWSTTWTFTGMPPDPRPVSFGGDWDTGGAFLQFSMGKYNPAPGINAKSELQAIRDFSVTDSGGRNISLFQHFISTLQNANLHVSWQIMPLTAGATSNFNIKDLSESAGFTALTFDDMQTTTSPPTLKFGAYRVIIDVTYTQATQNPSFWSNSFHRFQFQAL